MSDDKQHVSDATVEALKDTNKGWGTRPSSLANLRPAFTSSNAREMQARGAESKRLKREQAEALKITAEMYKRLRTEIPDIDALGIMQIAALKYLDEGNLEDASRIAALIAPYQSAKLATIEQKVTTNVTEMTDEQLKLIVNQLGAQAGSATGEGGSGPSD